MPPQRQGDNVQDKGIKGGETDETWLVTNEKGNISPFRDQEVDNVDNVERVKNLKDKWRQQQLVEKPQTPEAILTHAILGGLRTYVMAHGARGGLDFFLRLSIVFRKRKGSVATAFTNGFLGKDAIRFGMAFGGFSFLWRLINNGLRYLRGKDDRINGFIAGAVAGVSILAEKRERRITIAQQLIVRALQALYNAGSARNYFHFPHGDAFLFAVSSAQVLYAYAVKPNTIPPEFLEFMIKTARVPAPILGLNVRLRTTDDIITVEEALSLVKKYKGTPKAIEFVSKLPPRPTAIPCELIHSKIDSCIHADVDRFYQVFKRILPVYAALNTVSMFVFKLKQFIRRPSECIGKATFSTVRSSCFLATFVAGYLTQMCAHRNLIKYGLINWDHRYFYWISGFATSISSILVEHKRRRTDLALYVLPKAAESWYKIMCQRNWIFELHKSADLWSFSIAMGIIMAFYQHESEVLSPIVNTILSKFIGKN